MSTVNHAIEALSRPGLSYKELVEKAPSKPGLYAFYADERLLETMPWDVAFRGVPLYVGKSESSLSSRDVTTHFGIGKTGWSTVRRSLAVLLRDELHLESVPRNATLPLRPANYGLAASGDARLTAWMVMNLTVSFWVKPSSVVLTPVEIAVIQHWQPPLNLDKVDHPSQWLKEGRRRFADHVRAEHHVG